MLSSTKHECVFCRISLGIAPAEVARSTANAIVFRNVLKERDNMFVAIPKPHMSQLDLWGGWLLRDVMEAAMEFGASLNETGYRLVCNLGADALQSQAHAHLHVLGDTDPLTPPKPSSAAYDDGALKVYYDKCAIAPIGLVTTIPSSKIGVDILSVGRAMLFLARRMSPDGFRIILEPNGATVTVRLFGGALLGSYV